METAKSDSKKENGNPCQEKNIDDAEEEEDEDEEEPKLKYERISGDLRDILKKDGASCIATNSKLIIVGTNYGRIHVLDHQGNKVKEFFPHSGPVTMIDMDYNADYVASCSHDRKVVIQGLYTSDNCHNLTMDVPVRSVALDPVYYKPRSGRRFVIGENKVTLFEKTFLGQLRSTVLGEGSGLARAMKWFGNFFAWATDSGVRVMDMTTKTIITLIKRDHSLTLPSDQYPPHLCWENEHKLLIGWGDSVKVCQVKEREMRPTHVTPSGLDLPPYFVEIVSMFTTDFYICGIGPLDQHIVILAYNKQAVGQSQVGNMEVRRPQMRVLEPMQNTFEEISKDVLGIRCYQEYKALNYHLSSLVEDKQFFIVCPQDVVLAKPRDIDDRIQWLLQHNHYPEALKVVGESKSACGYSVLSVGRSYLDFLMAKGSYQEAAILCTQILGSDKTLWEEAVVRFNRARQLRVLSPHLPLGRSSPTLDSAVYQTVLLDLLSVDHQGFLQVVQDWPGQLYNVSFIINAVLETLARNTTNLILLQALAHLYSNIDKHDKALAIYLKLRHKDVFGLISRHNLYSCVAKHMNELMSLDCPTALDIACQHISIVPPDAVVSCLSHNTDYLYKYLDALYERCRDVSSKYHSQLFCLYADLDRPKLLPLLLASSSYDLTQALDICRARCLTTETIHLLDRMGNSLESLRLILLEENNIDWAIKLCKEHDDQDLWKHLIDYSIDKPAYIRELLNNIGTHVDPLLIIRRIPKGLEIPGLRDALVKILHDYHLQISLRTGCQRILVADCSNLLKKLVATQQAGIPVYGDSICPSCNKKIPPNDIGVSGDIIVFACRHAYHQLCLPVNVEQEVCVVCRKDKHRGFLI